MLITFYSAAKCMSGAQLQFNRLEFRQFSVQGCGVRSLKITHQEFWVEG